jgi:hypothetical protein
MFDRHWTGSGQSEAWTSLNLRKIENDGFDLTQSKT